MTTLLKPANLQPPMEQISIFTSNDNFLSFKFQPISPDGEKELNLQPFESTNPKSKWNNKHLGNFLLIGDNGQQLATKTIPVELLQGIVNSSNIDVKLWVEKGTKDKKKEVFNNELKFTCKNGVLTCLGQF